jgi:hypothetical protein
LTCPDDDNQWFWVVHLMSVLNTNRGSVHVIGWVDYVYV